MDLIVAFDLIGLGVLLGMGLMIATYNKVIGS